MVNGYRLTAYCWLCFMLPLPIVFPSYISLKQDTTQPSYPCKLSSAQPVMIIWRCTFSVLSYIGVRICTGSPLTPKKLTGKRQAMSLTKSQNAKSLLGSGIPVLTQRMIPKPPTQLTGRWTLVPIKRNNFFRDRKAAN